MAFGRERPYLVGETRRSNKNILNDLRQRSSTGSDVRYQESPSHLLATYEDQLGQQGVCGSTRLHQGHRISLWQPLNDTGNQSWLLSTWQIIFCISQVLHIGRYIWWELHTVEYLLHQCAIHQCHQCSRIVEIFWKAIDKCKHFNCLSACVSYMSLRLQSRCQINTQIPYHLNSGMIIAPNLKEIKDYRWGTTIKSYYLVLSFLLLARHQRSN